ncbi:CPBP family intramembrane metalloprotease [bacterium]|nr:CPBP family intramembrane metalloprotease [bacterium]
MTVEEVSQFSAAYLLWLAILLVPVILAIWVLRRHVIAKLHPIPAAAKWPVWASISGGAALAVAALALAILPGWILGGYSKGAGYQAYEYGMQGGVESHMQLWRLFAVQSLAEELLFRGIGMTLLAMLILWLTWLTLGLLKRRREAPAQAASQRLCIWFWSGLSANLVVAAAFGTVHMYNPNATWAGTVNVALAGLVLGQVFWLQANIFGAWSLHFIWNAGLATLGLPVSGIAFAPPVLGVGASGAREGLLSGGAFGPEGSLPCSIALLFIWGVLLKACWKTATAKQPDA